MAARNGVNREASLLTLLEQENRNRSNSSMVMTWAPHHAAKARYAMPIRPRYAFAKPSPSSRQRLSGDAMAEDFPGTANAAASLQPGGLPRPQQVRPAQGGPRRQRPGSGSNQSLPEQRRYSPRHYLYSLATAPHNCANGPLQTTPIPLPVRSKVRRRRFASGSAVEQAREAYHAAPDRPGWQR